MHNYEQPITQYGHYLQFFYIITHPFFVTPYVLLNNKVRRKKKPVSARRATKSPSELVPSVDDQSLVDLQAVREYVFREAIKLGLDKTFIDDFLSTESLATQVHTIQSKSLQKKWRPLDSPLLPTPFSSKEPSTDYHFPLTFPTGSGHASSTDGDSDDNSKNGEEIFENLHHTPLNVYKGSPPFNDLHSLVNERDPVVLYRQPLPSYPGARGTLPAILGSPGPQNIITDPQTGCEKPSLPTGRPVFEKHNSTLTATNARTIGDFGFDVGLVEREWTAPDSDVAALDHNRKIDQYEKLARDRLYSAAQQQQCQHRLQQQLQQQQQRRRPFLAGLLPLSVSSIRLPLPVTVPLPLPLPLQPYGARRESALHIPSTKLISDRFTFAREGSDKPWEGSDTLAEHGRKNVVLERSASARSSRSAPEFILGDDRVASLSISAIDLGPPPGRCVMTQMRGSEEVLVGAPDPFSYPSAMVTKATPLLDREEFLGQELFLKRVARLRKVSAL